MWGCDYLSFSGGLGNGIFMLAWILIIALAIYAAMRIYRTRTPDAAKSSQDRIDSMQILKARFAKGEITQEEFTKMKQILSQS